MFLKYTRNALLFFHCSSGYSNAPQCYVLRASLMMLQFQYNGQRVEDITVTILHTSLTVKTDHTQSTATAEIIQGRKTKLRF